MAAAGLAPFAHALLGLGVSGDLVGAFGDANRLGRPQRESVDRSGRPRAAGTAMAISHRHRLTGHAELDIAAEAFALIGLSLWHGALLVYRSAGDWNAMWGLPKVIMESNLRLFGAQREPH